MTTSKDTQTTTKQPTFLEWALIGNSKWWLYLFGTIIIFLVWQIGGVVFLLPIFGYALLFAPELLNDIGQLEAELSLFWMISALLTFIMIWVPTAAVVRLVHKRPFLTLFTAGQKLRWSRIGQGFALYGGLVLVASLIEGLFIHPEDYLFVYDASRFWWFALAILLLVPIQATAEEILFRGYILQGTSLATRNFIVLSLLNGFLFMLPHLLNTEVQISPVLVSLSYVISGIFFTYITLRDNGIELAIGAHTANNIFALMLVNLADSSITTSPLFLVTELDPIYALITQTIASLIFIGVFFGSPLNREEERIEN